MKTCSQCNNPVPESNHFCPQCGAPAADAEVDELLASPASDPTGLLDKLRAATAEEFTIIRELGRGGMGRVYLANEIALDRRVAMKVLPPALLEHQQIVQRFQREARTAGKLSHPNIVAVFQVSERSGLYFFTMPYVSGPSLRQILRKTPQLDFDLCRRYLREAADALSYAHGRGVIHRDVKPENMLLEGSRDGRLLLTDFGIAKALGASTSITRPGDMMGTPYYMSPEVCQELETIDGRSDQYSLGLVAYEMLAGRFPFSADSLAGIVYKQLHEQPAPLEQTRPDLPADLGRVIERATQKDPGDRYPTMAEFLEALSRGRSIPKAAGRERGGRKSVIQRTGSQVKRWLVAAAALAVAITGTIFWQQSAVRSRTDDAAMAELEVPSEQTGRVAADIMPAESASDLATEREQGTTALEAGVGGPTRPGRGVTEEGSTAVPTARSDPAAEQRQQVLSIRRQAESALEAARRAGAETQFAEEYTTLARLFTQADRDLAQGRIVAAASGFASVGRDLDALAARAQERAAEEQSDPESEPSVASPDSAARPSGGAEDTAPETVAPKLPPPEEAIAQLLEVYRQAFEAEDLVRIGADVYRGEVPESDGAFLLQWFEGASDFQVALELEDLVFPQEGSARARIRQSMRYKLARFGWDRSWEGVLRMSFAARDGSWRLVRLEAPR